MAKRNQRKRQREEIHKEDNKKSSPKRPKTTDIPIENKSIEPESASLSQADAGTPAVERNDSAGHVDEMKMETETDYGEEPEEDPEEDPEEYEEDDTSSQHNSSNEVSLLSLLHPYPHHRIIWKEMCSYWEFLMLKVKI